MEAIDTLGDDEALRLFKAGDRETLAASFLKLAGFIAGSHARALGGHVEQEELYGEACLGIADALNTFEPEKGVPLRLWVGCVIRQTLEKMVTKSLRHAHHFTLNEQVDGEDLPADPDALLWRAVQRKLSPVQFETLQLSLIGLQHHEIATRLGVTRQTVSWRLDQARKTVGALLAKDAAGAAGAAGAC